MKIIRHVRVSRGDLLYECHFVKHDWLCGACGIGKLGHRPEPGEHCPSCAARVEEALDA